MKETETTTIAGSAPRGTPAGREAHATISGSGASSEGITWVPLPEGKLAVYPLSKAKGTRRGVVLYVHGATFPASLAMGYRFDEYSWADDIAHAGFDAWGFDFLGYGASDRYSAMSAEPTQSPPLGRAPAAARQVGAAVRCVLAAAKVRQLAMVAHSWGSMPAALFACERPEEVEKLVLFGPILQRGLEKLPTPESLPGYTLITVSAQYQRFTEDLPKGEPEVLLKRHFERWAIDYLACDPESAGRTPPAVKTPLGPAADIYAAWSGQLPYEPKRLRTPTLLVRGEWDSLCADTDATWFIERCGAPHKADVKVAKGTHLMHLEQSRFGLYDAANEFLASA